MTQFFVSMESDQKEIEKRLVDIQPVTSDCTSYKCAICGATNPKNTHLGKFFIYPTVNYPPRGYGRGFFIPDVESITPESVVGQIVYCAEHHLEYLVNLDIVNDERLLKNPAQLADYPQWVMDEAWERMYKKFHRGQ